MVVHINSMSSGSEEERSRKHRHKSPKHHRKFRDVSQRRNKKSELNTQEQKVDEPKVENNDLEEKLMYSELETSLYYAQWEYDRLGDIIERVILMGRTLNEIRANRKLSANEIRQFEDSYSYHKNNLDEKVTVVVNHINEAKRLWEEKQQYMVQCNQQGILDRKVASQWNESLSGFLEEIQRIDAQLTRINIE